MFLSGLDWQWSFGDLLRELDKALTLKATSA
jgi:hypothetical protein